MNKLYTLLPVVFQSCLVSIYGYINDRRRYGKEFLRACKAYEASMALSPAKLKELQHERLMQFAQHAEKSVYWGRKFREYDVQLDGDIISELNKLPVMTKKDARDNAVDIAIHTSDNSPKATSGSTGAGLKFVGNSRSDAEQWAIWWRYWGQFGIKRGVRCGHFGGKLLVPLNSRKPPFHRVNHASKQVMFSAYHLSAETVSSYLDAIDKYRLAWLHGYASVISEVARLALAGGLTLKHQVRWISLGSENVTVSHARIIREFFGVEPIQHYGLAEGVANFSNRPGKNGLFVDEDFSYVEFLPVGEQYRIIGTNFTNLAFPLFRYDTGDLASHYDNTIFPRKVGSIDGRLDDVIKLPDGTRIGRLAQVFNDFTEVDESQILQIDLDKIVVRIVKNDRWQPASEQLILASLRSKLGDQVSITFDYSGSIARTATGKVRFVISEV